MVTDFTRGIYKFYAHSLGTIKVQPNSSPVWSSALTLAARRRLPVHRDLCRSAEDPPQGPHTRGALQHGHRIATGEPLVEGQPAGVSLREAEKWLAHWRLSGRAINARGELVWEYDPSSTSKKVAGGSVWHLLIHDEHVWLCDRYAIARPRNLIGGSPQKMHAKMSVKMRSS